MSISLPHFGVAQLVGMEVSPCQSLVPSACKKVPTFSIGSPPRKERQALSRRRLKPALSRIAVAPDHAGLHSAGSDTESQCLEI